MTPERLALIARDYKMGFGKPDPMPEIIAAFEQQDKKMAKLRLALADARGEVKSLKAQIAWKAGEYMRNTMS